MGVYNPVVPTILGEEWVPILNNELVLSPAINDQELGHTFTLASTKVLQDGRFYVNTWPNGDAAGQVQLISIYPHGTINETGPVRQVIIPCNSAAITGNALILVNGASQPTLGPLAIMDPSDGNSITLSGGAPDDANLDMGFGVNGYSQLLYGKRILRVRLKYVATSSNINDYECTVLIAHSTVGPSSFNTNTTTYGSTLDGTITAPEFGPGSPVYQYIDFGEVTPYPGTGTSPLATTERLPWTFEALQRFEQSIGSTLAIVVRFNAVDNDGTTALFLFYCALEVTYCDETRVAVGGQAYGAKGPGVVGLARNYILGQNTIPLRSVPAYALNPVLTAGRYDVVLSTPNTGMPQVQETPAPIFNSLRQLYEVIGLQGIKVNPTLKLGATYTAETTEILPQISLHTSGGVLPEVHVYGRQAWGEVWGTRTVTQEILDSAAGTNFFYPWVRFYARRFGDTTVNLRLDSTSPTVSGSGFFVSITPAAFDALDEIVDGWKAVTLRFPDATPPVMGAGFTPTWRFSATGELAGNRWEVLGAVAPALSGIAGNLLQLAVPTTTSQLGTATYGQPNSGSTVNMGWVPQYSPYVSALTDDSTADAVLMFSQDPPPVSGFTISTVNQPLSGIGLDCNLNPMGIPTALGYHKLSWPSSSYMIVQDAFQRTSAGFGTADTGQTWTDVGGSSPGDYNVLSGTATHTLTSANVSRRSVISGTALNTHIEVQSSVNVIPAGAAIRSTVISRYTDTSNYDLVDFRWATTGTMEIVIGNFVAGTQTSITNVTVGTFAANQVWNLVVDTFGTTIRAKAWPVGAPEPVYQAEATSAWTSGGVGLRSIRTTGNTDSGAIISYYNYSAGPSTWGFGGLELQRMDTIDTDWQTIMLSSSPAISGFNDYEARVGILTSYRIRQLNSYGFYGPWSATVTGTIPEPGVVVGVSGGHVLIFTTNSVQDGSSNLAYLPIWNSGNTVEEGFNFPEAGFVQLQAMYDRDFYVAFHSTERGGVQFSRQILVQAAAISPPTLTGFTSLSDMAWEDVPYICVRDEEGNRWFVVVTIPAGRVVHNRELYFANVTMTEVTATPSEVDP